MYHFVYQTTNLNNNKIYIGKHSTRNLNDGYMGSGSILLRAINKHGKDRFKTTILLFLETEEEAFAVEAALVDREFCCRDDTYNCSLGGERHSWLGLKRPDQADVMRNARPWAYRSPDCQDGAKNHRFGKPANNRKVVIAERPGETVIKECIKDMAAFLQVGRAAIRWGLQGRARNRDGWAIRELAV